MPNLSVTEADNAQNAVFVTGTTYYLSLHTADPGATGAHEGGAGRQTIQFSASAGGMQRSSTAQTWGSAPGGQTYTHFGVWTAPTGGVFKRGGLLVTPITPPGGSQINLAAGGIIFTAS